MTLAAATLLLAIFSASFSRGAWPRIAILAGRQRHGMRLASFLGPIPRVALAVMTDTRD
jgi:xanthine/uracil permease